MTQYLVCFPGYENIAPKTTWGRVSCIGYALLGIPLMLICLSNIGEVLAQVFRLAYHEIICFGCFRRSWKHDRKLQNGRIHVATSGENGEVETNFAVEGEDETNSSDDDDLGKSVPLTVTLCQLAWYIFFGALLFGVWEDWDWMKAAYFCFITMSTVGLGDVVPGTSNLGTSEGQQKMAGAAVYMLLGKALMSMVFALIQEEMVGKFQWIADLLRPADDGFDSRSTATEAKDSLEGKIGQNEPGYDFRMFDTFTTQYTPAGHLTGHDDQVKNRQDKRHCRKNVKVHPFMNDEYFEETDEM